MGGQLTILTAKRGLHMQSKCVFFSSMYIYQKLLANVVLTYKISEIIFEDSTFRQCGIAFRYDH